LEGLITSPKVNINKTLQSAKMNIKNQGMKRWKGLGKEPISVGSVDKKDLGVINEFDFKTKNIKGKENRVADSLSRSLQEVQLLAISTCTSNIKETIKEGMINDGHYQFVKMSWKEQLDGLVSRS